MYPLVRAAKKRPSRASQTGFFQGNRLTWARGKLSCFLRHERLRVRDVQIVTTSQMATKMVNPDGSSGSFDSGAKGIMVPQLGLSIFCFSIPSFT